jgi:hypothetical protein
LLQEATTIAALETSLATAAAASGPAGATAAWSAAVANLTTLTAAQNARANHVAGDLYALTAALDATTKAAANLLP